MGKHMAQRLEWTERIAAWMTAMAPLLRLLIPVLLLNILLSRGVHAVYIAALDAEIPLAAMRCIILGVHVMAAWFGLRAQRSHGWLYDTAACFLATEIVLFIYFMQDQFAAALLLVLVFCAGLVWLCTCGRRQLSSSCRRGEIPQVLMDDIIMSCEERRRPYTVFSVALRRYLTVVSAILLLAPSLFMVYHHRTGGVMHTGREHALLADTQDNQLPANLATIGLLEDSRWALLSRQEKINVLQVIADIETHHLNIAPVSVIDCHLENRVIGAYDHAGREAQIDMAKHEGDDPLEYVNTILHECRHAYQHDCIDSLDWADPQVQTGLYYAQARRWQYEHANYVSSAEDHDAYYNQAIEQDARAYAEEGVYVYRQYIYLGSLPPR